jgi:hypothetical protein
MRGMLEEIVRQTLESEPDLTFVQPPGCDTLAATLRVTAGADVVVVDAGHPEIGETAWPPPLAGRVGPVLLGIAADGREAFLVELWPHRVDLGELSPETLAATVRFAATPNTS